MHDVTVIDAPAAAEASLDPIRARRLARRRRRLRHPRVHRLARGRRAVPLLRPQRLRQRGRHERHMFGDDVDAAQAEADLKAWLGSVYA